VAGAIEPQAASRSALAVAVSAPARKRRRPIGRAAAGIGSGSSQPAADGGMASRPCSHAAPQPNEAYVRTISPAHVGVREEVGRSDHGAAEHAADPDDVDQALHVRLGHGGLLG
jgi:hypothetical protein